MPEGIVPQVDHSRILAEFLQSVSHAENMAEVSMAAGVAHQDLLGIPSEPYPEG